MPNNGFSNGEPRNTKRTRNRRRRRNKRQNRSDQPPAPRQSTLQSRAPQPYRGPPANQSTIVPNISKCCYDYIHTLTNPFEGPIGCVPSSFNTETLRQRVATKGTFFTGTSTNMLGFVLGDPLSAVANDADSVIRTDNTYSANVIQNASAAGVQTDQSNSNFVSSEFGSNQAFAKTRIVGAGLRVKYSGTRLNMGGDYILFQDPQHRAPIGQSPSSIMNSGRAYRTKITADWVTLLYSPFFASEAVLDVPPFNVATTIGGTSPSFYMLVAALSAVPQQAFDYEFFVDFEVAGSNIRGTTYVHPDPLAFAAALAGMERVKPGYIDHDKLEASVIKNVEGYLQTGLTGVARIVKAGATIASTLAPVFASII